MAERKFKLYDRVIIHDSFVKEHNDCVGEIFDFTCINGKYYYHIKLEDGRLSLGTPEYMLKLVMGNTSRVMRIEFETGCANSDGEIVKGTERDVCILYNETVITEDEVRELIYSGMYEYDSRVVVTTPIQADNLRDR